MPRRKQAARAVEIFDGLGPAAGLELELAPGTRTGYVGVSPVPGCAGRWQFWLSIEGSKRTGGSFASAQEAAIQRALMLSNDDLPDTPPKRKKRSKGVPHASPHLRARTPFPPAAFAVMCAVCAAHRTGNLRRTGRPDERERANPIFV